ncbi:hypothetical protein [Alicyclobacillus mali (ex Roth et al. 2021)]|uniref:hypothetical protein n=1 Tax=Alicyclobacillus mali (ex Roth et al. 2021) TaxID=1123961 RepID=UPI0023F44FD1|nr:hypothetical protein [Alicyclobacillus mali (ex Roth et al. 2021)]
MTRSSRLVTFTSIAALVTGLATGCGHPSGPTDRWTIFNKWLYSVVTGPGQTITIQANITNPYRKEQLPLQGAELQVVSRQVVEFRRACLMCDMVGFDPWRTLSTAVTLRQGMLRSSFDALDGRSAVDSHPLGPKPACAWSHHLAACIYLCNNAAAASWG